MSRHGYSYSTTVMAPRQLSNHGTSSAFSSSANPDEDWTQISDLAERRRIQNRIAQRNYRKKLKRRLEDLERRAGSSESPPEVHAQLKNPTRKQQTNNYKAPTAHTFPALPRPKLSPRVISHSQYTPPFHNDEETLFSNVFDRDGSHTPPLFGYQHYPPPEEPVYPPYPMSSSYKSSSYTQPTTEGYQDYITPAPMTLPSMMHLNESLRRDLMPGNDDSINPFSMSYAAMAGIDIHASHTYGDSNPHTPPLSHSFEHSAACSEAGFTNYPNTPLSMPPSPPLEPSAFGNASL